MKKRHIVLISLSFLLIGAFLPRFKPAESMGSILPAKSASAGRPDAVRLPSTLKRDEIYSALSNQMSHFEIAKLKRATSVHKHTPQRISTTTITIGQFLMVARFVKS